MIKKFVRWALGSVGYALVRGEMDRRPSASSSQSIADLQKLAQILSRHGCSYWLTSGTLLGAVRSGDFIGHDTDIDIAIRYSSFSKTCFYEIAAKFNVRHILGLPEESLEITLERRGITIDLFFVYEQGDSMRHSVFFDFRGESYKRADYVYPKMDTAAIEFLGVRLMAPEDPIRYLECNYGKDWRRPVKGWNYSKSPPHIRYIDGRIMVSESRKRFEEWME